MNASGGGAFAFTALVWPRSATRETGFASSTFEGVATPIGNISAFGILVVTGGGDTRIVFKADAVVVAGIAGVGPGIALFTVAFAIFSVIDAA